MCPLGGSPSLTERMVAAARELERPHDPQETKETAVKLSVSEISGCDAAALSLIHRHQRIDTTAATDEMARTSDQLQYEIGEGPCLDAIWEASTVHSPDLAADERWLSWGPRVAQETTSRSVLCFRLFTHEGTLGALNLYSSRVHGFDATDRDEGLALAAHIALAVSAAHRISSLGAGLDSRTLIGQAQGIVMERFDVDAPRAFALLSRLSQDGNVKLRALAGEVVETRQLPRASAADGDQADT